MTRDLEDILKKKGIIVEDEGNINESKKIEKNLQNQNNIDVENILSIRKITFRNLKIEGKPLTVYKISSGRDYYALIRVRDHEGFGLIYSNGEEFVYEFSLYRPGMFGNELLRATKGRVTINNKNYRIVEGKESEFWRYLLNPKDADKYKE